MNTSCNSGVATPWSIQTPLFPLKLLNILVFVLNDGTAGVVTTFIVSTLPV